MAVDRTLFLGVTMQGILATVPWKTRAGTSGPEVLEMHEKADIRLMSMLLSPAVTLAKGEGEPQRAEIGGQ
jgi:hypothetical protein